MADVASPAGTDRGDFDFDENIEEAQCRIASIPLNPSELTVVFEHDLKRSLISSDRNRRSRGKAKRRELDGNQIFSGIIRSSPIGHRPGQRAGYRRSRNRVEVQSDRSG